MRLLQEDDVPVIEVTCVECGYVQWVPVGWIPAGQEIKTSCSACWAVHARAFRLQKLADAVRPLAHEELKAGTTPSLFGPLNKRR